jgi:WD40 repeat protein
MRRSAFCLVILAPLLVLNACIGGTPAGELPRQSPTLPPQAWIVSAAPITLQNIPQIQALGVLQAPDAQSTLLDYALSPDGTRLAAVNNEQIMAWDLLTGEALFVSGRSGVTQLYYAPDKTELYGVAPEGDVVIFNVETGAPLNRVAGIDRYLGVATFDALNGWLALGSEDGNVRVWDMLERTALATIPAHTAALTALAFSEDGERLASISADGRVKVWNWRERTLVFEDTSGQAQPLRLAYSPAGDQIAVGTAFTALMWGGDGALQHSIAVEGDGVTQVLKFSPDGRFLLGGSRSGGIFLWDAASGEQRARLPDLEGGRLSAVFAPDTSVLMTSTVGEPVSLWNLGGIQGDTIPRSQLDVGSETIVFVDWTRDSRLLLMMDSGGRIFVWGIATAS